MDQPKLAHVRLARPVRDPAQAALLYSQGLGMQELGRFTDHEGFDGVMVGWPAAGYHFEFTRCRHHPVEPAATAEDLTVVYLPEQRQWAAMCASMLRAGFRRETAFNPYWERSGATFVDPDGYRVVLQNAEWTSSSAEA